MKAAYKNHSHRDAFSRRSEGWHCGARLRAMCKTGAFLPGVLLLILFYLRTHRVAPLVVAHWPMDIAAALI
jgi:hypothetical protein